MSSEAVETTEEVQSDVCCANCGVTEIDDIKLEECDGCDLVKYCGDKCREEHQPQHEGECKKRKAKLHDDNLFEQPGSSHHGECPICFFPMPLEPSKSVLYTCCFSLICNGCAYGNYMSNKHDKVKACSCPFCREPAAENKEENKKRELERAEANVPAALREMGSKRHREGDYDSALEYLTKAAELGELNAYHLLGRMYYQGEGVEKDEEKALQHLEKAAIGGHAQARSKVAFIEGKNGNMERSVKHFIIAANLGEEKSMKGLWRHYSDGNITKEELDATLRTHQAALDAMKSPQREAAERARHKYKYFSKDP